VLLFARIIHSQKASNCSYNATSIECNEYRMNLTGQHIRPLFPPAQNIPVSLGSSATVCTHIHTDILMYVNAVFETIYSRLIDGLTD